MIPRFVTQHPAFGPGLYLSKPGVHALQTTNPDDFLLHSGYKNEQIIKAGVLSLSPAQTVSIPFDAPLPSRPLVVFNMMPFQFGTVMVVLPWPRELADISFGPPNLPKTYRVECTAFTTHMVFVNMSAVGVTCHYMVMARSV